MTEPLMFNYMNKNRCSGCEACMNSCEFGALKMERDANGFAYPYLDPEKCVKCNRCIHVCPGINPVNSKINEIEMYAGYSKDSATVCASSSGGIFSELSRTFIKMHPTGKIIAVVWDEDFKGTHHEMGSIEQLPLFVGSKYIQSKKGNIYKTTQQLLKNEIAVLFVGCPCEVAALKGFLKKDYKNLYTIDLICKGAVSERVMEEYVDCLEKKNHSKIQQINLRACRSDNWIPQWSKIKFESGKKTERIYYETDLGIAFYYMQRASCGLCVWNGRNRAADITLGDFHGIDRQAKYYNYKGTSVVGVNTEKGKKMIRNLSDKNVVLEEVSYDLVNKFNPRLSSSATPSKDAIKFADYYTKNSLQKTIMKILPFKWKIRYLLPDYISNIIHGYKKPLGDKEDE